VELDNINFNVVEKHSKYLKRYLNNEWSNLEEKVLILNSVLVDLCDKKEYMFNYVEQILKSVIKIEREGK